MSCPNPEHLYGADLDGVQALIPNYSIGDANPSVEDVERFIDNMAAEVSLQIGAFESVITDSSLNGRINAMAKVVVETGAAAMTEDAAYPTRARPNDTSYGSVLWGRYKDLMALLLKLVGDATPGDDPGAGFDFGGAGVIAPPPKFRDWMPT